MKKRLITSVALLACAGAFGQGKLLFQNNTDQLIYLTTDRTLMLPADANKVVAGYPLAGSSLYSGYVGGAPGTMMSLTGNPTLIAGLFAGASADALSLVTTAALGGYDFAGLTSTPVLCLFGNLLPGVPAVFRIDVYDNRATSAADAWAHLFYAGASGIFTAVPQAAFYPPIWLPQAPVYSTLPSGTFVPNDYAAFPGYYGLIAVSAVIPEPGTFALAGLGLASLLIFHRRIRKCRRKNAE